MRKIKVLETKEVKEVTANEAHAMIESGAAELYVPKKKTKKKAYKNRSKRSYKNAMMTTEE